MNSLRKNRIFIGLIFIFASLGLLANKLGYFKEFRFFYIAIAIYLLVYGLEKLFRKDFSAFFFSLALIAIIFSKELGIEEVSGWFLFLIAGLLSIGFSLIFKGRPGISISHDLKGEVKNRMYIDQDNQAFMNVSFSSAIRYLSLEDFKFASAESNFAGLKLYLDGSKIESEAVLDLDLNFSGVEIYIPKEWTVIDRTKTAFGRLENNDLYGDFKTGERLVLEGDINFAAVKIVYV